LAGEIEMNNHISINQVKVKDLSHSILLLDLSQEFAEHITPPVKVSSDEAALRAFFWASAICHSTKGGLKGYFDGKFYKGWDYLLRAFCSAAEKDDNLVSPSHIRSLSENELYKLLTTFASEPQVTLPDLERRAEILNGCAFQLDTLFSGSVSELLKRASNKVGGKCGAYAQLEKLTAFQDHLKKKSSAFLMTVHFSKIWAILDQENVLPMIDYHRMRLLCRTGCIDIQDSQLLLSLKNQERVSKIIENQIRSASVGVCIQVVRETQKPMFDFDVLLWAHARSCCRYNPVCISNQLENDSFYDLVTNSFDGTCVFQGWCLGYSNSFIRGLWEPFINTEDY